MRLIDCFDNRSKLFIFAACAIFTIEINKDANFFWSVINIATEEKSSEYTLNSFLNQ